MELIGTFISAVILLIIISLVRNYYFPRCSIPKLRYKLTPMNQWITKRCIKLSQLYKPPFYLVNGHLQTWFATLWPKTPKSVQIQNQCQIINTPYYRQVVLDWYWIDCSKPSTVSKTQAIDRQILTSNHQKRIQLEESLSISHIMVIIPGWLNNITSTHVTSLCLEMANYFQEHANTKKSNYGSGFKCVIINPPADLLQTQQSHQHQYHYANHNSQKIRNDDSRSNLISNQDSQYPLPISQRYSRHLHEVLRHIHRKYPNAFISAVSISLGYALLLSYLSDIGASSLISSAVCISPSFDLEMVLTNLTSNLPYDFLLRHNIKKSIVNNHRKIRYQLNHSFQPTSTQANDINNEHDIYLDDQGYHSHRDKCVNGDHSYQAHQRSNGQIREKGKSSFRSRAITALLKCKTVRELYCCLYNIPITPVHHTQDESTEIFEATDTNIWEFINPMSDIDEICIPVLCLNAKDDPITNYKLIPYSLFDQHPTIISVTTKYGGHAGFLAENSIQSWSSQVAVDFIKTVQNYTINLLYETTNDQEDRNTDSNLI